MDFNTIEDAAGLVLIFVVFGVPALAIAARLAIRPMIEAIVRLRESFAAPPLSSPDPRLAVLEAEVNRLRLEVQRLSESEAFSRQLGEPKSPDTFLGAGEP